VRTPRNGSTGERNKLVINLIQPMNHRGNDDEKRSLKRRRRERRATNWPPKQEQGGGLRTRRKKKHWEKALGKEKEGLGVRILRPHILRREGTEEKRRARKQVHLGRQHIRGHTSLKVTMRQRFGGERGVGKEFPKRYVAKGASFVRRERIKVVMEEGKKGTGIGGPDVQRRARRSNDRRGESAECGTIRGEGKDAKLKNRGKKKK